MTKERDTVPFGKAYLRSILELVLVLPVIYFISIFIADPHTRYIILGAMAIYPLTGIVVCKLIRRPRWLRFILGMALSIVLPVVICTRLDCKIGEYAFSIVISFLLFYRGLMYTEGEWIDLMPPTAPLYIAILDFLALLVIGFAPALEPYRLIASITGPFIILTAIIVMNHLNLKNLADSRGHVSQSGKLAVDKTMNLHNRIWIAIILIAVLLVSGWRSMLDVLKYIFDKIMWLIMKILELTAGKDTGGGGGGGGNLSELFGEIEESAPNPFWEAVMNIFTKVISFLFLAAIVVLTFIAVYKIVKILSKYLKNLMEKEGSLIDDAGYVDTRESIIDLRDVPKQYLAKLRDRLEELFAREPKYSDMRTEKEKSTWIYRNAVLKSMSAGYKYKLTNTPSETLEEIKPKYKGDESDVDFIDITYNRAKFSDDMPDGEKIDSFVEGQK